MASVCDSSRELSIEDERHSSASFVRASSEAMLELIYFLKSTSFNKQSKIIFNVPSK